MLLRIWFECKSSKCWELMEYLYVASSTTISLDSFRYLQSSELLMLKNRKIPVRAHNLAHLHDQLFPLSDNALCDVLINAIGAQTGNFP
jgi:hypothetical protein